MINMFACVCYQFIMVWPIIIEYQQKLASLVSDFNEKGINIKIVKTQISNIFENVIIEAVQDELEKTGTVNYHSKLVELIVCDIVANKTGCTFSFTLYIVHKQNY